MKKLSVILPAILSVLIVFIGYYKVFTGHNFFIHEDWVASSNHTFGNKYSNGWRPDKGLGLSYFYGDPAMWHPWSLLSFGEKIIPDRVLAYTLMILVLDSVVVIAWFIFIRHFYPKINPWLVVLLVPLSVFCFDAPAQHYARGSISLAFGIPFGLWILFEYYKRPRWLHVCLMAFVWWFVAFTSNLWFFTQLLMLGFVFSIFYMMYSKERWPLIAQRFLLLHAVGLTVFTLLGAWVFYSFGLDQAVVGYVREKPNVFKGLNWLPEIKPLLVYLLGFIPFVGVPVNNEFAAYRFVPYFHGVSVIFIFAFLYFLGKRAEDFWQFALKGLLAVFFVHGILDYGKLLPAYSAVYNFISNKTSKIISMYGFVYCLEVLLIVLFLAYIRPDNITATNRICRRLQVLIAGVTVLLYTAALAVALLAFFFPEQYLFTVERLIASKLPQNLGGYSKELLSYVVSYNARRYQAIVTLELIIFFATSIVIAGVFLRDKWLRFAARSSKIVIAAFLLVNAFLLSWSIYPLNNRPMAWDAPGLRKLAFEPTDRFYFVRSMNWEKTPEGFRKKYMDVDGGYRKSQIGLLEPPGLNISGFKSFTSKQESSFMGRVFRDAGFDYKRLYYGASFVTSPLLDMAAVNYYYSDGVIENRPPQIVPFAQDGQVYIYKNTSAWPYYYLADRLQKTEEYLSHPVRATAYLDGADLFDLSRGAKAGDVRLKKFGYGDLVFEVDCANEEFLVVADAWHPFWKARTSTGRELKVYKTNEVFKGVRLEPGRYELNMYFDTRPYLPGVWISIVAWFLWAFATWCAYKDPREIVRLKSTA